MTGQYFKLNFTCIIHKEAIGREAGIFQSTALSDTKAIAPWTGKLLGESLLPHDVKHTHTSAYLELKPQLTWLCSPLPVLLKSS